MVATVFTVLLVLGLLIIFHEFGHFLVARLCGVQVETFSIGFGPKLWVKRRGPTEYCLSAIPLGGYVRMLGDDPTVEVAPEEKERSFLAQPVGAKSAVVLAGPFFNLLLAFFIFSGIFMVGVPLLTPDVGEVQKGGAADLAGMKPNDRIVAINDTPIDQWEEIRERLQKSGGAPLRFTLLRNGIKRETPVTPQRKEINDLFGEPKSLWLIGILPKGDYFIKRYNPFVAFALGLRRTVDMIVLNVVGIVKLIEGKVSSKNIGGPILVAKMASDHAKEGWANLLLFTAVVSINLAIINLFPVPILDGGHLLFFLIEGVLRRPVSLKVRERANQFGLFLLVSLMFFAFYNDIMRFFVE